LVVDKNALIFRDSEGKLLPMIVQSELFKGEVKLLPLRDGDFNEIKANAEKIKDEDIIKKHLIEPVLTDEELNQMPRISKIELIKLII